MGLIALVQSSVFSNQGDNPPPTVIDVMNYAFKSDNIRGGNFQHRPRPNKGPFPSQISRKERTEMRLDCIYRQQPDAQRFLLMFMKFQGHSNKDWRTECLRNMIQNALKYI